MTDATTSRATIVDFADVTGVPCPCGIARRAFGDTEGAPLTLHVTEITQDAQRHYHRQLTEVYFILECDGDAQMELDDKRVPVKPGVAVMIPPGVRHRAIGQMKVVIVAHPKFNPEDEWFD